AVSLANQPKGQRYSVANLTQPGGFAGVDGLFRLNQNGLSERRFAILQVQKFSNKIIKPSPKTFGREAF
ncbi:MAG: penicillin-binding protein activator, partial [Rhizobiales bacterium]|nr:penicillin-binding protein activator [Hyphomicrobiales bacterium]